MGKYLAKLCREYISSSENDQTLRLSAPSFNGMLEALENSELQGKILPDTKLSARVEQIEIENLSEEDRKMIEIALNNHLILRNLNHKSRRQLISNMEIFNFKSNITIINQGDSVDYFYIILSGKVQVVIDESPLAILQVGQSFGDMALYQGKTQNATIITQDKCTAIGLNRNNFRNTVTKINRSIYLQNKKTIKAIPIFQELEEIQMDKILSIIKEEEYPPDTFIVKENEPASHFYIIKTGKVACYVKNKKVKEIEENDYFGERSFLEHSRRQASVVSINHVVLLSIGRPDIIDVFGNTLEQLVLRNSLKFAIERSQTLKFLTPGQIDKIKASANFISFLKGETVIPANSTKSQTLYFVLNGSLVSGNKKLSSLKCLGDENIVKDCTAIYRNAYTAHEDCIVAVCNKMNLERNLGFIFKTLKERNHILSILKKNSIFRFLSKPRLETIANSMEIFKYKKGTVIFEEGEPSNTIYLIKKGSVNIVKRNKVLRVIEKNNFFGERSLILNTFRSAAAIASNHVSCWVLPKDIFLNMLDESTKDQILTRIKLQDDTITLADLKPLKQLGQGAFGKVILAMHSDSKVVYAVKTMDMKRIKKENLWEYIKSEENILLKLDHPMILKLVKTLKDLRKFYMITEYVKGQDLFSLINKFNVLQDKEFKFYAACFVLIMHHLHKRQIVYRDLKPENIMIDQEGYPKLVDFGTAKIVKARTYTFIGTPVYIAPEVILGNGYSFSADMWSLGVTLYELTYGKLPFGEHKHNTQKIFQSILQGNLKFPERNNVKEGRKNFIRALLEKNPIKRISAVDAKKHPWFSKITWNDYMTRKVEAPVRPMVKMVSEFTITNEALRKMQDLEKYSYYTR